jgi:LCP family protein required for cell wall assembly
MISATFPQLQTDGNLPDIPPPDRPARKRSPWYLKVLVITGLVLMVASGGSLVLVASLMDRYESKVGRENILEGVPAPQGVGGGPAPMNFLVLGSDSRADGATAALDETGSRSDTIMIVHVDKDRKSAFIASIPRDSYVNVPAGGDWQGGKNKINAAMAYGGANLTARTIYELTKIPLNGAMIVNFSGVHAMVGAVGSVHVCVPYTVRSSFSPKVWEKGCHDMGPLDAEEFMRQRMGTPGGDLGRIKNQQLVIKALANKIKAGGILTNPTKLDRLLTTATKALTVDKNLNIRDLVFALKDIDPDNIKFATTPVVGTMNTDAGSSVQLDAAGAEELFAAIREDRTDPWLAAHPQPEVPSI